MNDDSTTDDVLQGVIGLDEETELADEIDGDLPPPIMTEDGEEPDDSDEAMIDEGFTTEGEEGEGEKFDPEDPDAYLYGAPEVKYSDSAEENEADWLGGDEEF